MSVEALHLVHSCVVCSDLDRSVDFYTTHLGAHLETEIMEIEHSDDFAGFLSVPGSARCRVAFIKWGDDTTFLELQQYLEPGGCAPRHTKDIGISRIALKVPNYDAALVSVRASGIPIVGTVDIILPTGARRKGFSLRDPDGLLIELIEYFERLGPQTYQLMER